MLVPEVVYSPQYVFRKLVFAILLAFAKDSAQPTPVGDKVAAQSKADLGSFYVTIGRLDDARTNCDAALKISPANQTAQKCLAAIERTRLAPGYFVTTYLPEWLRLDPPYVFTAYLPDWLRQLLIAFLAIAVCWLLLIFFRNCCQFWRALRWQGFAAPGHRRRFAKRTRWTLLPLKELPEPATGIPTMHFLTALTRLPFLLKQPLWNPHLLLLRPTPPEDYAPAIIDEFLSSENLGRIVLWPKPHDLGLQFKEHDVQVSDAIQNLQFKIAAGLDVGSLAKFLAGVVHWFNAGSPTISGIAQTEADKSVTVHISATRNQSLSVSVAASTPYAPGIDVTRLSARRAALKLLLRNKHPAWTDSEIEGYSALRQAASLFSQYAGTSSGSGDSAHTRRSSLRQAACDFSLFRASVPIHSDSSDEHHPPHPLIVKLETRQADLLAEGIAHALAGGDEDLAAAVLCFRELQDWSGTSETSRRLRCQAAYNEAIVLRLQGFPSRAVLKLTELLNDYPAERSASAWDSPINSILEPSDRAIRLPARVARLAAFAEYSVEDLKTVPQDRIKLLTNDGKELVSDLTSLLKTLADAAEPKHEHDRHVAQYLYLEALRAMGHVEVFRVSRGLSGAHIYDKNHRPSHIKKGLDPVYSVALKQAIDGMKEAEKVLPGVTLYCDLAEAHLLLGDFQHAAGYARDAILQAKPPDERALYLASESLLLEGSPDSRALAEKYAAQLNTAALPEFVALREELHIRNETSPRDKSKAATTH